MNDQILQGDALQVLQSLPSDFIQTVITSPPYYGLRDYGMPGQIGLEETPEAYIARLVEVFREVRRVLRPDGTLWLNWGDSYGVGKQLLLIPARLALALQADKWVLRMDCIWHKPNCMPESVEDRPTKSHEYIFLLAKSEQYYYDAQAIQEPMARESADRYKYAFGGSKNIALVEANKTGIGVRTRPIGDREITAGRNKRSVWTVSTVAYSESHFATFPPKLIEPCILASTSPRACEHCGAPWERVTERGESVQQHWAPGTQVKIDRAQGRHGKTSVMNTGYIQSSHTIGWQPTCTCTNEGTGRCMVLDPFMGAGTVALMALRYARYYLGIELNPDYVKLAERRIACIDVDMWESEGIA